MHIDVDENLLIDRRPVEFFAFDEHGSLRNYDLSLAAARIQKIRHKKKHEKKKWK